MGHGSQSSPSFFLLLFLSLSLSLSLPLPIHLSLSLCFVPGATPPIHAASLLFIVQLWGSQEPSAPFGIAQCYRSTSKYPTLLVLGLIHTSANASFLSFFLLEIVLCAKIYAAGVEQKRATYMAQTRYDSCITKIKRKSSNPNDALQFAIPIDAHAQPTVIERMSNPRSLMCMSNPRSV